LEVASLKDIYTDEILQHFSLEDRHIKALLFIKENGRINNSEYQKLFNVSKRTVTNDLQLLMAKDLLKKMGATGRGTYYILSRGNNGAITSNEGNKGAFLLSRPYLLLGTKYAYVAYIASPVLDRSSAFCWFVRVVDFVVFSAIISSFKIKNYFDMTRLIGHALPPANQTFKGLSTMMLRAL